MKPFPEADQFLKNYYLPHNNLEMDQIAYVGYYYYPKDELGNQYTHWRSVIGIIIQCVVVFISFFLVFFYGFKCYRQTKFLVQQSSQSSSFENLQSQLFYALVFQTLIPIVLMHLPAAIVYTAAVLDSSLEVYGRLISLTICFYPAIDPLPNFFIIKSYRKAILDFIRWFLRKLTCRRRQASVTPASHPIIRISSVATIHLT